MLGIPTVNIDRMVRLAIAGIGVGRYNDDNDNDYDILVTRDKTGRPTMEVLNNLFCQQPAGCRRSLVAGGFVSTGAIACKYPAPRKAESSRDKSVCAQRLSCRPAH